MEILSINPTLGLTNLGFDDFVAGSFVIDVDLPQLQDYLQRLLLQTQADEGLGYSTLMFGQVTAWVDISQPVDVGQGRLVTRILLADERGGPGASISRPSTAMNSPLIFWWQKLPGSESTQNNANAPRDMGKILTDAFSAAMARVRSLPNPPPNPATLLMDFDIVIVGFVLGAAAAPIAEQWSADDPVGLGALREAQSSYTAIDSADPNIQLKSRWILAFLDDTPAVSTLCHELGHAYGFDDTYHETDHRDDLGYGRGCL